MSDKYQRLIDAQREYIDLLTAELEEVTPISAIHGWKSKRFELGEIAREKIKAAQRAIEKDMYEEEDRFLKKLFDNED